MKRSMRVQGVNFLCLLSLALSRFSLADNHYQELLNLKPKGTENSQKVAVVGLVKRLLPNHAHLVEVVINNTLTKNSLDKFKVEGINNKMIRVSGNTGVAAANGLYYYLKYVANCSISWSGDQLTLPVGQLPMPASPIERVIRDKFRYYQNVCTVSYSMVWWDWARWEREIDWMALHGINLPLAFNGQEMVFQRTFQRFNLTIPQIDEYFTGPAFLAWNRMGNIQTWSGPLSENWHQQQMELQKQILKRMRSFGMFPVVPGFAGHVPRQLAQVLRNAKINQLTDWNNFGRNYSYTYFLEPEDPKFAEVGKVFLEEYIKLYGTDHFYNIDLFNEETPASGEPEYLKKCGQRVFNSIVEVDPNGIWVMQGWLFYYEATFWGEKQIEAMVTSVPQGKLLLLDLFSEIHPVYPRANGYYGQPFLWCMLHNFGGTIGMYGAFNQINEKVFDARNKYPNMLGIGLTPEGIEQNDIMYEYMSEVAWHKQAPDMARWVSKYVHRRYATQDSRVDKAWQLLRTSVYTDPIGISNHGRYTINVRPELNFKSTVWYDQHNVTEALRLLAQFINSNSQMLQSETFVYDLVDVTRQTLQLLFDYHYEQLNIAFIKRNEDDLNPTIDKLEHVLDLTELVLQASKHTLLFNWIDSARKLSNDTREQNYNEWQARNQISIWGPKANIVDYAAKQWSGMIKYFYKPRWRLFFTWLQMDLLEETKFDQKKFELDCFNLVEIPFTHAKHQNLVKRPDPSKLVNIVNEVVRMTTKTIDLKPIAPPKAYYFKHSKWWLT